VKSSIFLLILLLNIALTLLGTGSK